MNTPTDSSAAGSSDRSLARGRALVFAAAVLWGTSATLARFVFRDRLLVRLLLVVGEHALHAFLVPARWVLCVCHGFFRRRRSAFKAFGPRSYAVITNTDPGSGSGT